MTKEHANKLLDGRRRGLYVPQYAIAQALAVTGDLPPAPRLTKFRRRPVYSPRGQQA